MKQPLFLLSIVIVGIILVAGTVDLNNLFPYNAQLPPNYINKSNAGPPQNDLATLGRVLFYDKNLSANNTVACATCHQQEFAFSDPNVQSIGLNGGLTGRHSMRLINARFANEAAFFWDERAATLEDQVTQPIQDHVEMGFSGTMGDPNFNDLIIKLEAINYYNELFTFVFGDATITEARMQAALADFIRSIQSFDSKFDDGLALVNGNLNANFPNFTPQENLGKAMFIAPPGTNVMGGNGIGAGCQGCHQAPEFDIDPNTQNNGVIGVAGGGGIDLTNTRSPSLRDLVNPNGVPNGPFMHNGIFNGLAQVINHYDAIPNNPANTNLDPRLNGGPGPGNQNLGLSGAQKDALISFLETLTGSDVYTAEQWSSPFDANGYLDLVLVAPTEILLESSGINIFHNPTGDNIQIELDSGDYTVEIRDASGNVYKVIEFCNGLNTIDITQLPAGTYFLNIQDNINGTNCSQTILKQ